MTEREIRERILDIAGALVHEAAIADRRGQSERLEAMAADLKAAAEALALQVAAELTRLVEVVDAKAKESGISGTNYANGRRDGLEAAGTELYRRASELRGED